MPSDSPRISFVSQVQCDPIKTNKAKQSIHAKLYQLTRENKATYWMKGVFTFHIFALFI